MMPYDANMRTTVTLDDDLAMGLDALRKQRGLSFKKALNLVLRAGLARAAGPGEAKPYTSSARPLGLLPGSDPTRLGKLYDEVETSDQASRLEPGRR